MDLHKSTLVRRCESAGPSFFVRYFSLTIHVYLGPAQYFVGHYVAEITEYCSKTRRRVAWFNGNCLKERNDLFFDQMEPPWPTSLSRCTSNQSTIANDEFVLSICFRICTRQICRPRLYNENLLVLRMWSTSFAHEQYALGALCGMAAWLHWGAAGSTEIAATFQGYSPPVTLPMRESRTQLRWTQLHSWDVQDT